MKNRFLLLLLLFGTLVGFAGNRDGSTPYWQYGEGTALPGYTGGGNMTFGAAIHIDGVPVTNPNYELAAFQNGGDGELAVLQGKFPVTSESTGEYLTGPTGAYVYGLVPFGYEDVDACPYRNNLTFKIYDHESNQVLDLVAPTFTYQQNWNLASYDHPLILNFFSKEITWEKVTDASTLAEGDRLIITSVGDDEGYAMNEEQGKNDRGSWPIVFNNDGSISWEPAIYDLEEEMYEYGPQEVILYEADGGGWGLFASEGFLYAASNSKDWLRTQKAMNANSTWSIDIEDGVATIVSQGSYSHNTLQFDGDEAFVCTTGDGEEVSIYRMVLPADVTTYTITVAAVENGTVNASATEAEEGETITVTVEPGEGYQLAELTYTYEGTTIDITDAAEFEMPAADVTINATFELIPAVTYTITVAAVENGTVNASATEAEEGETITVTVEPSEGYQLDALTYTYGDNVVDITDVMEFDMPADNVTINATFTAVSYAITVDAVENGEVTPSATEAVAGAEITVTVIPAEGYELESLTYAYGSTTVDITDALSFEMPAAAVIINATFVQTVYTITMPSVMHLTLTPNVTEAVAGTPITITVEPELGYLLESLTYTYGDNTIDITEDLGFTMPAADVTVNATWWFVVYNIVVADGIEHGDLSCASGSSMGQTISVDVINVEEGYHLESLTYTYDDNTIDITEALSFEMPAADVLINATFALNTYTVEISAGEGGSAAIDPVLDVYEHGTHVTVTATPDENYQFTGWTGFETAVTEPIYEFDVTSDMTLVANFAEAAVQYFMITTEVTPEGAGTVTGGGNYEEGSTISLTAAAAQGYNFIGWLKDGVEYEGEETIEVEVTAAATYTAQFEIKTFTVTLNAGEGGSAIIDPEQDAYDYGTTVTVTAAPDEGYLFSGWTGFDEEVMDLSYEFEVTDNMELTANFELIHTYTITVAAVENGTVTPSATEAEEGTVITVTVEPAEGYRLAALTYTDGENTIDIMEALSFEMPAADVTINATFELIPADTYTITVAAVENGTVTPSATEAEEGETITVTVEPAEGYQLAELTYTYGDNTIDIMEALSFEMPAADVTINATFELIPATQYTVTTTSKPESYYGSITGAGSYDEGSTVVLVATANPGYAFLNWVINGEEQAGEESGSGTFTYTIESIDADVVAEAWFELSGDTPDELFSVTVDILPKDKGTVTGAGQNIYAYGATADLTAIPVEGWEFDFWADRFENPIPGAVNPNYSVLVNGDIKLSAHFKCMNYLINVTANNTEGGTVSGGGTYDHGTPVTVIATANEGYTFVNWTEGGEPVSEDAEYGFVANRPRNLVANFELNSYNVVAVANNEEYGMVGGSGSYTHGSTVTLTATAYVGYHFVKWTENGEDIPAADAVYTFEVTEDHENLVAVFEINTYNVTVTANEGGTAEGGATVNHGESITVNATANEGYHFVGWLEGEEVVSMDEEYTFVVTANHNLVADFEINSYAVTAVPNDEAFGSVTGSDNYPHGATATLTAVSNEGYHFVKWMENGEDIIDASETYSFVVTEAHENIVAVFEINTYTVTVTANEGGTAEGGATVNHGESITVNAAANEGYHFAGWLVNDEVVSTDAEYTFVVTSNLDLVADFEINSYVVTAVAEPVEGGTITGSDNYAHGTTATLVATENPGYSFDKWTDNGEDVTDAETYSFVVTENHENIVAHFTHIEYNITVASNDEEYGTVAISDGPYYYGETITLTATPTEGHVFMYWTKNGSMVTSEDNTFVVDGDAEYVAVFGLEGYEVTVIVEPEEGGEVNVSADAFEYGNTVTLTAIPTVGYDFIGWTINDEPYGDELTTSFTLTSATTVYAQFALHEYNITVDVNEATYGTAQIVTDAPYYYNDEVVVNAEANYGYHFENWTVNGEVVSTDAEYTFNVAGDCDLVANFAVTMYTIAATSDLPEGGSVIGAGEYAEGTMVTLTAVVNEHYRFLNWTENGEVVSSDAVYEFVAEASRTLVAHFEPIFFTVTVDAVPNSFGTVTGGGSFLEGSTVTVFATAKPGYRFINWTRYDIEMSTNPSYSFTLVEDISLTAHFEQIPGVEYYQIDAIANPAEGGTVTGAGEYAEGSNVTLVATVNEGYTFEGWTENGEVVALTATYTFVAEASRTLVANFAEIPVEYTITIAEVEHAEITAPASSIAGELITVDVLLEPMYRLINLYYYTTDPENTTAINLATMQFVMPEADVTIGAELMLVEGEGDVNLDGEVNILDVLATINFVLGDDVQPFDFEQADMNDDGVIDISDALAINALILGLKAECGDETVTYAVVDGKLMIESEIALAGYQFSLSAEPASIDMPGFTTMGKWSNGEYILVVFNLNGEKESGLYTVLDMGDAALNSIVMSTREGCQVRGIEGTVSVASFDEAAYTVFPVPANTEVTVAGPEITTIDVFNMMGQKVMTVSAYSDETVVNVSSLSVGSYLFRINTANGVTTKSVIVVR